MATPFGFSVGDCLAAVGLVIRVSNSLQDSRGASTEYQHVMIYLQGLQKMLVRLQSLQPGSNNTQMIEQARLLAFSCMIPLQNFLTDIEKYKTSLGNGRTTRSASTLIRSAQWGIFMEDKLAKLRSSISAEVLSLILLLGFNITEGVSRLETQRKELHREISGFQQHQNSSDALTSQRLDNIDQSLLCLTSSTRSIQEIVEQHRHSTGTSSMHMGDMQTSLSRIEENLMGQETLEERISDIQRAQQQLDCLLPDFSLKASSLTEVLTHSQDSSTKLATGLTQGFSEIKEEISKMRQDFLRNSRSSTWSQQLWYIQFPVKQIFRHISHLSTSLVSPFNESSARPVSQLTPRVLLRHDNVLVTLQAFYRLMSEFLLFIYCLRQLLPRLSLRYLPSLLLEDNIVLEDAAGRKWSLQFNMACNWEVFEPFLRTRFSDHPGKDWVSRGLYSLRSENSVLTEENWATIIRPRAHIAMSLIIKQWSNDSERCPRRDCNGAGRRDSNDSNKRVCTRCGFEFGKSPQTNNSDFAVIGVVRKRWAKRRALRPRSNVYQHAKDTRQDAVTLLSNRPRAPYRRPKVQLLGAKRCPTDGATSLVSTNSDAPSTRTSAGTSTELVYSHHKKVLRLFDSLKRVEFQSSQPPTKWIIPVELQHNTTGDSYLEVQSSLVIYSKRHGTGAIEHFFDRPVLLANRPLPPSASGMIYYEILVSHSPSQAPEFWIGYRGIIFDANSRSREGRSLDGAFLSFRKLPTSVLELQNVNFSNLHSLQFGNIIGCRVDPNTQTLSFLVNGKVVLEKPTQLRPPLFPAVVLCPPYNRFSTDFTGSLASEELEPYPPGHPHYSTVLTGRGF